jgi:phosphate transport system protein
MTETSHIVKSFDLDLEHLNSEITNMGELVIKQLEMALQSVVKSDAALAQEVIDHDPSIDAIEHNIDTFAIRTIALRQPVASDLRAVISALKVSSHLERIADYATNVAKRAMTLSELKYSSSIGNAVPRLMRLAQDMIKDVLNAYISRDDLKAKEVWSRDVELDEMYMSFLRELLTYMMEDPRNITACTQFLFIAKNIERIGDHATNIAELVHYLISGHAFEEPRPKGEHEQMGVSTEKM